MEKATFTCYATPANYEIPGGIRKTIQAIDGHQMEHVFVTSSDGDDWGCFGRGASQIDKSKCRIVAEGQGIAEWARLINGHDQAHPTGITNFIDGTCHCVANRLLVLAGVDACEASGNFLVNFMYGKYVFGLNAYRDLAEKSANELNTNKPYSIPDSEVARVLAQIEGHITDELAIMQKDFEAQFPLDIETLPDQQRLELRRIYEHFHSQRIEAYQQLDRSNPKAAQLRYFELMQPALTKVFIDLQELFGIERYAELINVAPDQAVRLLLG
ncbi:MAG: hypothetical protein A2X46_04440 [Lentisphaerae bacterium GWF2_57_35]|nr:MAG: hypothetical protein A2X46_04440 [Lentisphaerae bacterium GWF2_57_35]